MKVINFSEPLCKGVAAFQRIAFLQKQILESEENDIILRISTEGRIGLTFVFLLGSLPLYAERKGKRLRLLVSQKMYVLLSRINVIDYYKLKINQQKNRDYQIAFDDLLQQPAFKLIVSPDDIIAFVDNIQMEVPVDLSEEMRETLTSRIGEVYLNALEHSASSIVLGGKYFKFQKNKYCFSCYDNGIGIPTNVNDFFVKKGFTPLTDIMALKWAMQKGHSTDDRGGVPRGVGLDLLRSFAIANGAVIRICSGKALYVLDAKKQEHYYELKHSFDGTLFEMDIFSNCVVE